VEKVETYAITGATGRALYESIGERGPKLGPTRAIAHTTFKLTWSRDYVPKKNGACTLAAARPKLVITYLLPKLAKPLPAAVQARWATFVAGIEAHERVHGEMIKDLVREIEAVSIGLTAADDPGCKKVRAALQERLAALSQAQRQRSRDFDRDEMSQGGNVHRLILALIGDG
jgi:predicted secreted Zn-dependent protease